MKYGYFGLLIIFFFACKHGCSQPLSVDSAWSKYEQYRESAIVNRLFKHSDLLPLIERHAQSGVFTHEILGNSAQGRSIHHLTAGIGKTKILLWSQMHGDEATATMALFDLFNYFSSSEPDTLRSYLLKHLELHFIPMLNPDGAEAWKRRNALDIDINRDARMLNTPEGRVLKKIAQDLKPMFGFNLHDQGTGYAAGPTPNQATISFLAPAYNFEKDMNTVRLQACQLIVRMNQALQLHIPGRVARYNDAHDPRCFGDQLQASGISTILIESGGYPEDLEKQYIRKLNFYVLLHAFVQIASSQYELENLSAYEAIPENRRSLYDLVVRNVTFEKEGQSLTTHIGIGRMQLRSNNQKSVFIKGVIEEFGDLDRSYGYEDYEIPDLKFKTGSVVSMPKKKWEQLTVEDEFNLLKEGILFVEWSDKDSPTGPVANRLLNLCNKPQSARNTAAISQAANFLLTKNNVPAFAVINGFWVDLSKPPAPLPNAYGY